MAFVTYVDIYIKPGDSDRTQAEVDKLHHLVDEWFMQASLANIEIKTVWNEPYRLSEDWGDAYIKLHGADERKVEEAAYKAKEYFGNQSYITTMDLPIWHLTIPDSRELL